MRARQPYPQEQKQDAKSAQNVAHLLVCTLLLQRFQFFHHAKLVIHLSLHLCHPASSQSRNTITQYAHQSPDSVTITQYNQVPQSLCTSRKALGPTENTRTRQHGLPSWSISRILASIFFVSSVDSGDCTFGKKKKQHFHSTTRMTERKQMHRAG